jgi:hypothetical protein
MKPYEQSCHRKNKIQNGKLVYDLTASVLLVIRFHDVRVRFPDVNVTNI